MRLFALAALQLKLGIGTIKFCGCARLGVIPDKVIRAVFGQHGNPAPPDISAGWHIAIGVQNAGNFFGRCLFQPQIQHGQFQIGCQQVVLQQLFAFQIWLRIFGIHGFFGYQVCHPLLLQGVGNLCPGSAKQADEKGKKK